MFFSTRLKPARLPPSVYWCMDLFYLRCKPLHYSGILLLWLYYYWAVESPVWIPGICCSFLTGSHWTVSVLWAQLCNLLSACLAALPACGSSASRNLTSISAGYTHHSPLFHLASHLIIEGNFVKHDLPLIPVLASPFFFCVCLEMDSETMSSTIFRVSGEKVLLILLIFLKTDVAHLFSRHQWPEHHKCMVINTNDGSDFAVGLAETLSPLRASGSFWSCGFENIQPLEVVITCCYSIADHTSYWSH